MGTGTRRLSELRGFSPTNYVRASASVLAGNPQFTAQVLMRYLGPTAATQFLAGNQNGATGWSIVRLPDSAGSLINFRFTVHEAGVAQILDVIDIEALYGKFVALTMHYDSTNLTAYLNGVAVGTLATTGNPLTASSGIFSIGYNLNAASSSAVDSSFLGFAYVNQAVTVDNLVANHLELIKRQELTNGSISWTHLYSVARDAGVGVPSVLRNGGTYVLTSPLTVIGRATFILGTPIAYLGDASKQAAAGGGGDVSGPGGSTDNAAVRWDGATGTQVANSVVIIEDDGDIETPGAVLLEDTNGDQSGFQAPAVYTTPVVYTLPLEDGASGEVLSTDGSGVLSWAPSASGDVTGPGASTDNAIPTWNGIGGDTLQNTALTITGATVVTAVGTSLTLTSSTGGVTVRTADTVGTEAASVTLRGGDSETSEAGNVNVFAGSNTAGGENGGNILLEAGNSFDQTGGTVQLRAGNGDVDGGSLLFDGGGGATGNGGNIGFEGGIGAIDDGAVVLQFIPGGGGLARTALYFEDDTGARSGFVAPANYTTPTLWTLPVADGTIGQALSTNGTGALAWTSVSTVALSAVAPVDVTKAAAAVGVAVTAARSDHKHDVTTAVAGPIAVGDAAAEGTATTLARSDHVHSFAAPAAPVNVTKSAASAGVATTVARADHKHDVTTATAVSVTSATNAEGTATSLARSDHTHAHGDLLGGTLHAVAVAGVSAGFLSAADKTKIDSLPSGPLSSDDIGNDSTVSGTDVTDALDALNTGKAPVRLGIDVRAATHVATAADVNRLQQFTAAGAVNFTINNSVLQAGDVIPFLQYGAGAVTVNGTAARVAEGGFVTTGAQYKYCTIVMLSATEVLIVGTTV